MCVCVCMCVCVYMFIYLFVFNDHAMTSAIKIWGPFHKSSYEQFLLYEFVEPMLNYGSNEFVSLTKFYETGP